MIRIECFKGHGKGYKPPLPAEIRELTRELSTRELASLAGVHRSTALNWRSGKHTIPYATWELLLIHPKTTVVAGKLILEAYLHDQDQDEAKAKDLP